MKKSSVILMSVLASACMAALANETFDAPVEVQPLEPVAAADSDAVAVDESPQRWFVELDGAPLADGGKRANVRAEKQAFRSNARAARLPFVEHYAFDGLFNGLSISVDRARVSALMRLPGVKAVYPVATIDMPQPGTSNPELLTALAMTGADVAQNELGLDGSGIRVAVMDTGIDIDHPDFGGSGTDGTTAFPSARIVAGYDFVGDDFASPADTPVEDDNPDDCHGHGTHVAGIVGANGAVKGVAPNVSFGAYRVFGCTGSTSADIMIAAMERALEDDMDVLNMSIGSTYQWPQYPTAQAATRLVNKGMVVVASAGNSGGTGMYSTGAPSVGDKVISVASFDNTHVQQSVFTVSPDDEPIGYSPASASPLPPTSGSEPMARTGTASSTADGCAPLPAGSLDGQVALIRRLGCTFHTKALNAQNAGATGVVLYNHLSGGLNATVAGSPAITIPVVGISDVAGELIDGRLAGGPVDLTWTSESGSFPNPSGGLISGFSSYGMSPDLQLKPDIGAPGGAIYSTYPLESGGYATISGTSMSAPHVAGAAALLLQSAPKTPSQAVGRILQNSAQPKPWSLAPGFGLLDHAHRQGAGMLRIDDAVVAATRIEPGKLSLGESEAGPSTHVLELENNGDTAVTYELSSVNALSTGANTFASGFYFSNAGVEFGASSITLQAGASASLGVTITPPTSTQVGGQYGGYLVFTPDDGSATLRVPFAGYVGDYQDRQVLTPTTFGFPWLAKLDGGSYFNQAGGATYSMVGSDIPFFLIHFDHQSRRVRMDVVDADTGRSWHRAFETEYFGRNSGANSFFAFSWDGVTTAGKKKTWVVPDGDYVVKLSVLKALGDDSNPEHWEHWESPVITIDRP